MRYVELYELFNKPVDYYVIESTDIIYKALFKVGSRQIRLTANAHIVHDENFNILKAPADAWDVVFSEPQSDGTIAFGMTGSSNEFEVMSTVKAIVLEFFKLKQPSKVRFTSDLREKSRTNLYTKMTIKFVPSNYTMTKAIHHGETAFTFLKK